MKYYVSTLLVLFLCISCGSTSSTDKQGLTITNNKTYPGGVIKAKIVSGENIKQISVGINGILTINSKKPEGNKWEGEADIPTLNPGKYEIAFVVTPFDAPSTTLTSEIEVVNKPTFDVQTSSVDGKKKITVKGDGISSVELQGTNTTDTSKIQFTKTNGVFEYQGTPQPTAKLLILDSNNLIQEKSLSFETQNAIFFSINLHKEGIGNEPYFSSQSENQSKFTQEERLMPFEQEDDLMKSLLPNSTTDKIKPIDYVWFLGMSPNQRYLFLSSTYGLQMKKTTIDSGRKLMTASVRYYYIYDRETKQNHLIDKLYRKTYYFSSREKGLYKESGSYYYPVFWGDDELLVIQVKKGESFIVGNEIEKYPNLLSANQDNITQSMDATPKCMSISLKDFTMKESTKVKPITPWVCWADQYKGIISWVSPTEKSTSQLATLPDPERGTQYPHFVSDLSGDHVWNVPAQAKTVLSKDEKYVDTLLISATYWKGKKAILLDVCTDKKFRFCVMDMDSGFVETIEESKYDVSFDFGYEFEMLNGTPYNPNSGLLALLKVSPIPVNPYDSHSPPIKDVEGVYISQITTDGIKLLWKINAEGQRAGYPFFISEVVK